MKDVYVADFETSAESWLAKDKMARVWSASCVSVSQEPQIIFNNVTAVSTTINVDNVSDNL